MTGAYAAAWMPSAFVPLMAVGFFVALGLLFNVVEASD
ncbi:MAG: photosystem I reaction center subunit VIII [Aphanocapsa feldmannii 277cV]|uniref:Photosystem I reaction center subunit VIII n=2 Tax=Aphanocapsa feldmannii TaxID=192050 RepID=A0A524RMQ1_9CHRO|nr:MAG: photosystem I reaction center subunit VIII [Aphanocapsa feldmannii 288cV]TGG91911.1 MAG: photosystem I reaction center subunit VIII [Aphanocapsa feldmannii 277cV]TGH27048.1 MAG: photosystem I reaction center subunit VIII [Aphanocapsa feldmannii 277cI]